MYRFSCFSTVFKQIKFSIGLALGGIFAVQGVAAEPACLFEDSSLPASCDSLCSGIDDCCGSYDTSCFSSNRQYLTGDWGGLRTDLAESGINFQADVTQFNFRTVSGGLEQDYRYSGHGDYVMNIDAGKLGLQEGLFVKVRAEHRFGESLAGATGAALPSTVLSDLPVADNEELLLTDVLFTQAFSQNFAVFFGKMNTLDGDVNAFAHGRGKSQFSNLAFVASPMPLRTVPYSTLGAGFVWMENGEPIFTFTAINPIDTASTIGLNELFAEGVTLVAETRIPTTFFNKPGHQLVGGTWSSRDYVSLNQDPRIIFPVIPIAQSSGSWSLYWNFDQYLVTDPCDPTKGWGVFGRAGVGDDDTNPLAWFLSFGVGGTSPIPGRSDDGFGAGWYYSGLSDEIGPLISAAVGGISDGQGIELFYRAQLTPWFHVSPDFQIIFPGRDIADTAYVLGLRSNISF